MPAQLRRTAATGNEYPLLVDQIFAGWYEAPATIRTVPNTPTLHYSITPTPTPTPAPQPDVPEPIFHTGDPLPGEVDELKRLGISEDQISEMWGRFSPERIAKILGATVSQVRIAAAWTRRTFPLPAVATCAHCGTSHSPRLQSLDHRPVCSEVCQIELNARLEAANIRHPEADQTSTIISGSLNADTVRELLVPSDNRLPRDAAVSSGTV